MPLIAAFVATIAGWVNKKYCFAVAALGLTGALTSSVGLLSYVLTHGPVQYRLGGWAPPFGIAYQIDPLNALILVVIAAVALLNLLGTQRSVALEFSEKIGAFYTLYLLFVVGMLGIVSTGDAFNLFVLLEIASITGYALIGMGRDRAPLATLNYIFMGTIGASFYLLGVGYLYLITGSLNMADIAAILPQIYASKVVLFAFIFCMAGLFMKMAFFPVHGWLPNAYAYAPSAAAGLIAPLTTKVMVYAMVRIALFVFKPEFTFEQMGIGEPLVWAAVAAIVMGSLLALAQRQLKKMLAYVIVAEVGYMVGGFWLGNRAGISGAVLHIVNDAAMTLVVFMAAGNLFYRLKGDSFGALKGVFREMPVSMAAFVVGALSIIGVPPTCGFFSKWYLISGAIEAGHYGFVAALLFSSLVNAVLFFRIIEIGYFEPFTHANHHGHHQPPVRRFREVPMSMLVPLLVAAGSLILLGVFSGDLVTKVIHLALPGQIT